MSSRVDVIQQSCDSGETSENVDFVIDESIGSDSGSNCDMNSSVSNLSDASAENAPVLADVDEPVKPTAEDLRNDLGLWVTNRNINLDAADELLALLRHHGMTHLPKTARSLLSTPRTVELKDVVGGQYYHFGIAQSCKYGLGLSSLPLPPAGTQLSLYVNVDGVNVTRSTNAEFYPILGKVAFNIESVEHVSVVFIIGLFYGDSGKPGCVVQFMKDFVDDCNEVQASGLTLTNGVDARLYRVKLKAMICDAPARAFVKCVKAHGGYYACDYCETKGEWYASHGVVYPDRSADLRTERKFRAASTVAYKSHLMGFDRSPLLEVDGFDIIGDVTPEYMHTVTLGVVKKNVGMWCSRSSQFKVRLDDVPKMSERLMECGDWCPTEMGRRPRSLHFRDKFKATEWRSLLLYTGFYVFKGILTDSRYEHHLLLACAMKLLLSPSLTRKYCDVASRMLNLYVKQYIKLYGRDNVVYNVHMLIHFADAARRHGSLERIGAFAFESYMRNLRAAVRKPNQTLKQVVKRELERRKLKLPQKCVAKCEFKSPHCSGVVPRSLRGIVQQFGSVHVDGVRYARSGGDSFVFVQNEGVARIENLLRTADNIPVAAVRFFDEMRDHFKKPLASSQVGVWRVSALSDNVKARAVSDCRKVWFMPVCNDYSLCVELAHTADI